MKRVLGILILMMGITAIGWGRDYEFVKEWDGAFQSPLGLPWITGGISWRVQ